MEQNVLANYDPLADVLYLSVGEPDCFARSFEDDAGLIWRQVDGTFVGVTVPDYEYCWKGRERELAKRLVAHLPKHVVAQALASAH